MGEGQSRLRAWKTGLWVGGLVNKEYMDWGEEGEVGRRDGAVQRL